MMLVGYLHLLAAMVCAWMAVRVLAVRATGAQTRFCGATFIAFGTWSLCFAFVHNRHTPRPLAQMALQASAPGGILSSATLFYFVVALLGMRRLGRWLPLHALVWGVGAGLIWVHWSTGAILRLGTVGPQTFGWPTVLQDDPWTVAYYIYCCALAGASLILLLTRGVKGGSRELRRQSILLLGSLVVALGLMVTVEQTMPWVSGANPHLADLHFVLVAGTVYYLQRRAALFTPTPAMAAHDLVEVIPEAVMLVDGDGRIVQANRSARGLADLTGEIDGRTHLGELFSGELGMPLAIDDLHRIEMTGATEVACSARPGRLVPVLLSTCRAQTAEGGNLGWVCVACDMSEARELERQVVAHEERERVRAGHDLHDGLGQILTGLSLTCSALLVKSRRGQTVTREDTAWVTDLVKQAEESLESITRGIVPVDGPGGLAASLEALVTGARVSGGAVTCLFRAHGVPPVCDEVTGTHLYRIAQEALGNALRHARAGHIEMHLDTSDEGGLVLSVDDDGVGFDAGQVWPGMGLRTMRHRARMLGAALSIGSAPGSGTRVLCRVPASPVQQGRESWRAAKGSVET